MVISWLATYIRYDIKIKLSYREKEKGQKQLVQKFFFITPTENKTCNSNSGSDNLSNDITFGVGVLIQFF